MNITLLCFYILDIHFDDTRYYMVHAIFKIFNIRSPTAINEFSPAIYWHQLGHKDLRFLYTKTQQYQMLTKLHVHLFITWLGNILLSSRYFLTTLDHNKFLFQCALSFNLFLTHWNFKLRLVSMALYII